MVQGIRSMPHQFVAAREFGIFDTMSVRKLSKLVRFVKACTQNKLCPQIYALTENLTLTCTNVLLRVMEVSVAFLHLTIRGCSIWGAIVCRFAANTTISRFAALWWILSLSRRWDAFNENLHCKSEYCSFIACSRLISQSEFGWLYSWDPLTGMLVYTEGTFRPQPSP